MRILLAIILYFITSSTLYAQESPFRAFHPSMFEVKYQHLDSNANAVVIEEFGRTRIQVVESESAVRVIHHFSTRIKILNQEGFDKANFTIPLYKYGNNFEFLESIRGTTYNLENGRLISSELNKKQIFNEKHSENVQLTKLTFPDIREGSVIELHYSLVSPDIFNFRTWQYQDDIPKIFSEYKAEIPANYTYNVTLVGPYKLTDQKSNLLRECFTLNGVRVDCSQLIYTLKDIPPFIEEEYMLAPKNYIAAIKFELVSFQDGRGGNYKYTKEWKDVDRELLNDKNFGSQLKKTGAFKNIMPEIINGQQSSLDKAKAIYNYIKNQIKWNNYRGMYAQFGVEDVLKSRTGNIGDINLSLAAGLTAAGIECYPVLLSTRANGLPNSLHPVISDFDYVIVLALIDGKEHLLDASEQFTPFGELPLRAINHNGRVIYSRKSSAWLPIVNPATSKTVYNLSSELGMDGKLKGKLTIEFGGLDAMARRNEISKYPTTEEYIEFLQTKMPSLAINNLKINNAEDVEQKLSIEMDMEFELFQKNLESLSEINFNGILFDRINKNPFNLDERNYAVDLGAKKELSHSIIIKMPSAFKVKEKPKDAALSLPAKAARFIQKNSCDDNVIMINQTIVLDKSIFNADEYFYLKEFYSRIIQQQKLEYSFIKN